MNKSPLIDTTELDLNLIYEERIGDIIFLIGTILALISTYQAAGSIINKLFFNIKSSPDNSAFTITAASWLFLISSFAFAHVAIIRYNTISITDPNVTPLTLKGSKITALGNIIKVVGFGLAAIGNQLKLSGSSPGGPTIISQ